MKRLLTTALLLGPLMLGCSDDETTGATSPGSHTPCKNEPWGCPAGETCWIDYEGAQFLCQAGGPGGVGAACVNAMGQPTCAEGLACYHLDGQPGGQCAAFCDPVDPDLGCEPGVSCRPILYTLLSGNVIIHLCEPAGSSGTGGSGGTGGQPAGGGGGAGGA